MLLPLSVRHECSVYTWDCGGRPVRLRQRVMPSHALRLLGSEATTAFQLNKASSCCPRSSSSDAKSHRARISVGQTARSFCNSVKRSIRDSLAMGRTHSISRIDEWVHWSRDVRPPDDADPVDSSGAFNRLSPLTSRSTSYNVFARIGAIRILKVRLPRCCLRSAPGPPYNRQSPTLQAAPQAREFSFVQHIWTPQKRDCAMMLCR